MRQLSLVPTNRATALKLAARALIGGYAAFAGLNAQAADLSAIEPAFGNTVISTYPDGRTQKIWLHRDGSWDGISRKGTALAGHWSLAGDKVCMRQSTPPTLPVRFCTPFPAHGQPGMEWDAKDVVGHPIRLSLVRGAPPSMTPSDQLAAMGAGGRSQVSR